MSMGQKPNTQFGPNITQLGPISLQPDRSSPMSKCRTQQTAAQLVSSRQAQSVCLSFQLLLAQSLVSFTMHILHGFLLLQQRTNKHKALPWSPTAGPDGLFPKEIHPWPRWCLLSSRELAYPPPLRMQRSPPSYCMVVHPTDQVITLLPRGLSRLQPIFISSNLLLSLLHVTDLTQPTLCTIPSSS